jgi:uncharacterized protein
MPEFVHRSRLDAPAEAVFAWHARPGAFERLVPPWQQVEVLERRGGIKDGGRLVFALKSWPFQVRWEAVHRDYEEGRQFRDVQIAGPFAEWSHTHRILPDGAGSILEDRIVYRLPGGILGERLAGGTTRRTLERTFRFRHARTRTDLARHARFAGRRPLRVAITGASGLIGGNLAAFLTTGGHRVDPLVRGTPRPETTEIAWNPAGGTIDAAALEGVDAVVHLAGESVAGGRWTPERKAAIRESRARGTALLAAALARLARKPRVLVSASAIGWYGDRGDETLTEESGPGHDFLADVCREWEAATDAARAAGIRVVNVRFGIVLAAGGGALARMLPPFRLGAGGVVGSGNQYMSWIGLDDVVGAIHHLLFTDGTTGPVNGTAPAPVTNAEFTRTLGHVLGRPTIVPLPAVAVRAVFGEMGDALLLASQRVLPTRLEAAGFRFEEPALESALRTELGLYG